jgi:sterol desaturase/sphingolipid hydroxylase (fatty acid hydroxylase superfamily)
MLNDFAQLWLVVFTFDTLRYLFGASIVSFVLFIVFKRFSESRRIQAKKASWSDIRREITNSLITTSVYALVALATVYYSRNGGMNFYSEASDYSMLWLIVSLPLILILHDAYFYWVHRAMHWRPIFRYVHRTHHLSRTPTPWAAYAFAPGEAFMMALFMPLMGLTIPFHEGIIVAFLTIMIVRNAMGHSGIEFHPRGWIDSPFDHMTSVTHHDLHHQRVKGNYGLYFTWWDRWMGTEFEDYHQQFIQAVEQNKTQDTGSDNVALAKI